MTNYIHRMIVIVLESEKDISNMLSTQITGNEGDINTFDIVKLSPTGNEPVTHYGCNTVSTEEMRISMEGAEQQLSGVWWWRLGNPDGLLKDSSTGVQSPGQPFNFDDAINEINLKRITE